MRDFAHGQRCGSLISTIASVQECPDLTGAQKSTSFVSPCCYFGTSKAVGQESRQEVARSESPFGKKMVVLVL